MTNFDSDKQLLEEMIIRKTTGRSVADLLVSAKNHSLPSQYRDAAELIEIKMNRVLDIERHSALERFQVDGKILRQLAVNEDTLIKKVQTLVGCVLSDGLIGPETIVKVNQYLEAHDLRTQVQELQKKSTPIQTCTSLSEKVDKLEERQIELSNLRIPPSGFIQKEKQPEELTAIQSSTALLPNLPPNEAKQVRRKLNNLFSLIKPPKEGWDDYLRRDAEPEDALNTIDRVAKLVVRVEASSIASSTGKKKFSKNALKEIESGIQTFIRDIGDKNHDNTLDSPQSWKKVIQGLLTRGSNKLDEALIRETLEPEPELINKSSLHKEWQERTEEKSTFKMLTWFNFLLRK